MSSANSEHLKRVLRELDELEATLEQTRINSAAVMEHAPLLLVTVDEHRIVQSANAAARAFLGAAKNEIIDKRFGHAFKCCAFVSNCKDCPTAKKCEKCEIKATVNKVISTRQAVDEIEVIVQTGDETQRFFLLSAVPIRMDSQELVLLCMHDITERKRLEAELSKAQRLESLGTLAGAIAHDLNNLLTIIIGNTSLAKVSNDFSNSTLQSLTAIEGAAARAGDLANQLLTFAAGGAPLLEKIDTASLIRHLVQRSLLGEPVSHTLDFPDNLWSTRADPAQLKQALGAIVKNATQAAGAGGSITIKASNVILTNGTVPPLIPGRYIRIDVVDQGPGISVSDLQKVFDPYFSTRPGANGLGLTAAYSIMRRHEGHLIVSSQKGDGTTARLYLPVAAKTECKTPAPTANVSQSMPHPSHPGRVLLMDDEELLRYATSEMLQALGWEVVATADGQAALDAYQSALDQEDPFDAVILDLTVHFGMGGRATIKRLYDLDPSVRAIVSSGYHNDPIMANFWEYGFQAAMAKPYTMEQLKKTVSSVAGRASSSASSFDTVREVELH